MKRSTGFTLIELLIVVAIIAILAAIAVPNFLEAQTRSKVSRCKADMRALATALEAYAVDHSKYPIDGAKTPDGQAFWYVPGGPTSPGGAAGVSSPIAYITSAKLIDPFRTQAQVTAAYAADAPDSAHFTLDDYKRFRWTNWSYTYNTNATSRRTYEHVYGSWRMSANGPDGTLEFDTLTPPGGFSSGMFEPIYDATNGTVSRGNIVRSQKHTEQPGPHGAGF